MGLDEDEGEMNLVVTLPPEMPLVLLLLSASYLVCVLVFAWALRRAPEGFEDKLGYQPGRQPIDDDQVS
jgi:hypothetical protein